MHGPEAKAIPSTSSNTNTPAKGVNIYVEVSYDIYEFFNLD
jgi:hypothetical protein